MPKLHAIKIKRIYDPPEDSDGYRVLFDRLWPRGVKKNEANIDHWAWYLAPSTSLRKWFSHRSERFSEFRARYLGELEASAEATNQIRNRAKEATVTLLYASRDRSCNHAIILQEFLSRG